MVDQTPDSEIERLRAEIDRLRKEKLQAGDAWQRTLLARHDQRPYALDYVERLFQDFSEIHGDRRFSDDPAIVAGMATYHGHPVMVIGQQKGRDLRQRQFRNFGYAQPEGYRKALRAMKLAEKFSRAIVSFVDTPGAYPSVGAEERGQAEAIAQNLREMSRLNVPVVVCIIGEGGSGGALGIAVGNHVLMMENAIYTVITPEGCSAIIWKDQEHAAAAATALKMTAPDLLSLGIIDEIVPEPPGGAQANHNTAAQLLDSHLKPVLESLLGKSPAELRDQRYFKFRRMGAVETVKQ
ncbi:MAG: acetyl-coenzyme carboxylase carboxyl transferase subunit alpha [Acidobacteria bacterium]|jgi:acetyl-CoA carboxylase carboxyl transferase subunit alpha|nr:acetyl-coenzyme carboxylase carboxyl transferase subunit alpha [Acidobacteriota bacterium]